MSEDASAAPSRTQPELAGVDGPSAQQADATAPAQTEDGVLIPAGSGTEPAALDVAEVLGEDIIFGRLPPGTRLVEDHLIARFGATRHYIRQALNALERTGIVVRERNKGVAVRSLTPAEVRQIYEVRELLQRQAALRIVLPAPHAAIEALERLHDAYAAHVRARDFRGVHALNDRFHLALFGCCGNAYLVDSIRHYMWLSLPVRARKTADIAHALASERDHHMMIQLLKGTDTWALAQLCVEHLHPAKASYLDEVDGQLASQTAGL